MELSVSRPWESRLTVEMSDENRATSSLRDTELLGPKYPSIYLVAF